MEHGAEDTFEVTVMNAGAGADYMYVVNGERERPDAVSRWQPRGVHGPSRVFDPQGFAWTDGGWRGIALEEFLIYELHTGTFTHEGTFEAIIPKLSHLKRLGVTAVELMPVAEFPGGRNWGYDGTYLYAPQSTYGGPEGLKRLIDACHKEGLAVVMDVVYNHFGPEGNYAGEYAPVASLTYRTPWGDGLNFDSPHSDGVRRFFIDNALYWLTEYHIDALRLDAIQRMIDISPRHILEEMGEKFHEQARRLNRSAWLIAESDLNDVRVIKPAREGGYGLDAQWSDDFHHALHAQLTKTKRGCFADFGRVKDLAKAIKEGFVYDGQFSGFRRKSHGNSSGARPGEQFVICVQNHDQVANSYWGDRLAALVSLEEQKLAAAVMLCAPNLALLFMGQEWGETTPFLYFTSHTDPMLAEAVRRGREREYASYVKEEGRGPLRASSADGDFRDPQSPAAFEQSKIVWSRIEQTPHAEILRFYSHLIAIRKQNRCLSNCDKRLTSVTFDEVKRWMVIERGDRGGSTALLVCNLAATTQDIAVSPGGGRGAWQLAIWSGDALYGGASDGTPPRSQLNGEGDLEQIRLSGPGAVLYIRNNGPGG
jgi:maltooligosyltrehalose trehalohydrolase